MKRILYAFLISGLIYGNISAQSAIEASDSPDFTISNTSPLTANSTSRLFFKNGGYFTGGIETIGTTATTARLAFVTQVSTNRNTLQERLTILNNGFIGVANNNPQYQFHVKTVSGNGFGFTQESSDGQAKIGFWTNGVSAYLQTHNNVPLYFATNNLSAQMTLTTAGRLGIGTTVPVSKLEVKGKTTISQQIGDDVALEISGPIKVSGPNPAAFVVTAGAQAYSIEIDHPACNGNPNAIILVTNRFEGEGYLYEGNFRVKYSTGTNKWIIQPIGVVVNSLSQEVLYKDCNNNCGSLENVPHCTFSSFLPGMQFNVLVISK